MLQGDLAMKKIYPTLWWLFRDNLLPIGTIFTGYSRSNLTTEDLKAKSLPYMKLQPEEKDKFDIFWKINNYVRGSYDKPQDFERLNAELLKYEDVPQANRIFYLALPPSVFQSVTKYIKEICMGEK